MKHWGIILLLLLLLSGCGQVKEKSESADVVVAALAEAGYQVTAEQMESQIFTGACYRLSLEGEEAPLVTVYVYGTAEQADHEANGIDESGFGIKYTTENGKNYGAQVDWVSEPHFFLLKNLIVQYIGTDDIILQKLQELCGLQIAGAAMVAEQQSSNQAEVSMQVVEDSISRQGLTVELYNEGQTELEFDADYRLMYKLDGVWQTVRGPEAIDGLAYILPAGEKRQAEISHAGLAIGVYQISKVVRDTQQSGNPANYVVTAEFIVD